MKDYFILFEVFVNILNVLAQLSVDHPHYDNCQFQGDIYKLRKEGKCVSIKHGASKQLHWEECQKQLNKKVGKLCHGLGLQKVSEN